MKIVNLSKEEIINLLLKKNEIVNFGIYGFMLNYENDYIKLFHKKLSNTFPNPTPNNLDKEIKLLQTIETLTASNYLQSTKEKITALQNTSLNDLIKAIVTYNNYPIGVIFTKYQNYIPLIDVKNNLTIEEKITILTKIKKTLKELQDNNIYITTLNDTNFIIRTKDKDIKLVNIDPQAIRLKPHNTKPYILTKTFLN